MRLTPTFKNNFQNIEKKNDVWKTFFTLRFFLKKILIYRL